MLQPGGELTICTDDSGYGMSIVNTLTTPDMQQYYKSAFGPDKRFSTTVPDEYGSSYFDRFFTNKGKHLRFFIRYLKI